LLAGRAALLVLLTVLAAGLALPVALLCHRSLLSRATGKWLRTERPDPLMRVRN
jgi:hypothetical protein